MKGKGMAKPKTTWICRIAWICSTCGDIKWKKSKDCEYCSVNGRKLTKWIKAWVVTYGMRKKLLGKQK